MTPRMAFNLRDSREFETLHDLANYADQWRFQDALGHHSRSYPVSISRTVESGIRHNRPMKVYRTALVGRPIVPGSYVTESKQYAVEHGRLNIRGGKPVLYSLVVRPSELAIGDAHEFFYVPEDLDEAYGRFRNQVRLGLFV